MVKPVNKPAPKQPVKSRIKKGSTVESVDRSYSHDQLMGSADQHMSVPQMVEVLKRDPNADIDATVIFVEKTGEAKLKKLNKAQFIEHFDKNKNLKKLKEAITSFDSVVSKYNVGGDDTAILGGPFNKQLYLYDYLRMHNESFKLFHEDPIANAAVQIIHDFVLGRGFRIDITDKSPKGRMALALVRAWEDVNDIQSMISSFVKELSIYGEHFIYEIPDGYTKDYYQLRPDQMPNRAVIPRSMLVDPSTVWEVITYPEDITRVLAYQQVYPTQYQLYSTVDAKSGQPPQSVTGTKFIYRQIPADQMIHNKINCVSNEKRGRSDFYPVIGYLKRLRDSINYSLLNQLKQSAWSIDTEIDGDQADIDAYQSEVQSLGTIPSPGSEFIHSTKVKRTYISNTGGKTGAGGDAWDYSFSMVCAGLGIPMQYFGTHLSGGGTRGNAIVATEPVAKKFETRQLIVERLLKKMISRLFNKFGVTDVEVEITFPEVVVQDRTAKIKDVLTAKQADIFSQERTANVIAKELQATNYDWTLEQQKIKAEKASNDEVTATIPGLISPLTTPPLLNQTNDSNKISSGIDNEDKASLRKTRGY